jgi:spore coat polysaccharide biosynthesis protein SpsF
MEKKKIVASVEARMTSSRLPGKVLMEAVDGMSMLEFMIKRIIQSSITDIVVATTVNVQDDPIVALCEKLSIPYFRGSEDDVLKRVLDAHEFMGTDIIVELTGDCPLIDPNIIDKIVAVYLDNDYDYVSNAHVRSYPDGLDVQVFSKKLLAQVEASTMEQYDRENVSSYIYRSGKFRLSGVVAEGELYWPDLRITLDDTGDYHLIKSIIEHWYPQKQDQFDAYDIVSYVRQNIHLLDYLKGVRKSEAPYQVTVEKPSQD